MPVENIHSGDFAYYARPYEPERLVVGGVPCGFVVRHYDDAVAAGQVGDAVCMLDADRQRFLYHYVDAPRGACFHHLQVVVDWPERHYGFGFRLVEHSVEVGIEQRPVDFVVQVRGGTETVVCLPYAHDREISAVGFAYHFVDMPVRHSRNTYAERFGSPEGGRCAQDGRHYQYAGFHALLLLFPRRDRRLPFADAGCGFFIRAVPCPGRVQYWWSSPRISSRVIGLRFIARHAYQM